MRRSFLVGLLIESLLYGQALSVSGPDVVKQATTGAYVASGGTPPYAYALESGSAGSINSSTGVYTAPAHVIPKQVERGCQVTPNNSVWNTKVSSPTPVHANDAAWQGRIGVAKLSYEVSFPFQPVLSTDPTTALSFYYKPSSDVITGLPFHLPSFPRLQAENGPDNHAISGDHHSGFLQTDTCLMEEIYQLNPGYPAWFTTNLDNDLRPCPGLGCRSASGARYDLAKFDISPSGSDAGNVELLPLTLRPSEVEGTIKHALRITMAGGFFNKNGHVWPAEGDNATTSLCGDGTSGAGGCMPYGTRLRLKASVSISPTSICTNAHCQTLALNLITQLKDYGIIVTDIGTNGGITVTSDEAISQDLQDAFKEIASHGPASIGGVNDLLFGGASSSFEVVDESSYNTQQGGGGSAITWGEVAWNNAYHTPDDYVIVKVTDSAGSPATVRKSVALQGVVVGVERATEVVMAGAGPIQFAPWVTGAANTNLTCSLSPSGGANGTVTSGCLYTPAATVAGKTITTMTVTSAADGTVTNTFKIIILPPQSGTASLYIDLGNFSASDYTDTASVKWFADQKLGDPPMFESYLNFDFTYSPSVGDMGGDTVSPGVYNSVVSASGDLRYNLRVPNGVYRVDFKLGDTPTSAGNRGIFIEAMGVTQIYGGSSRIDPYVVTGHEKTAFTKSAVGLVVTNRLLSFSVRGMGVPPPGTPSACCTGNLFTTSNGALLSGLVITQTSPSAALGPIISGPVRLLGPVRQ